MPDRDISNDLQQQVQTAAANGQALRLHGGGSKAFYGEKVDAPALGLCGHSGIISYEPTELVLTARCGTPLAQIEKVLAEHQQKLAFEPPYFGGNATLGGAIASGLAGPARPWGGAPRDSVLGVKLLDGQGRILDFGGQVMKNVAGYDVSRLMAGAQGTLGILLEISVKVLPAASSEMTLILDLPADAALHKMRELARQPAPLSGACHWQNQLYLRLGGNAASVDAWRQKIGGEAAAQHSTFWQRLRDHQLSFFVADKTLWRLSLPPATPKLPFEHDTVIDWAGAQRWVYSQHDAEIIRHEMSAIQGHAEAFRHAPQGVPVFQPMQPRLVALHKKLQQTFDPKGIFRRFPKIAQN